MTQYIEVKDTTLKRDVMGLGLVETDYTKAQDYKAKKAMLTKTTENIYKVEELQSEVASLKNDMSEIKQLLKDLLKKDY